MGFVSASVVAGLTGWLNDAARTSLVVHTVMFAGPLLVWSIQNLIRIRMGLRPAESGEIPPDH